MTMNAAVILYISFYKIRKTKAQIQVTWLIQKCKFSQYYPHVSRNNNLKHPTQNKSVDQSNSPTYYFVHEYLYQQMFCVVLGRCKTCANLDVFFCSSLKGLTKTFSKVFKMQERGLCGGLQGEGLKMKRHLQMKEAEAKVVFFLRRKSLSVESVGGRKLFNRVFGNVALEWCVCVCMFACVCPKVKCL